MRDRMLGEPKRYPFGRSVKAAGAEAGASGGSPSGPTRDELLAYLEEVRGITRGRLERMASADFDRTLVDADFGSMSVRDLWSGAITSFAWHAGQAVMTIGLMKGGGRGVRRRGLTPWCRSRR